MLMKSQLLLKLPFLFVCFCMQDPSLDLQAFESRVQRSLWLQNSFSLPSHFIVSKPFENKLREQFTVLQFILQMLLGWLLQYSL